jgi:hypothetical protein
MGDDDDDDIHNAPPEVQDAARELVRAGHIVFAPQALASMREKGLTEDQVVAMMREAMGIKPS